MFLVLLFITCKINLNLHRNVMLVIKNANKNSCRKTCITARTEQKCVKMLEELPKMKKFNMQYKKVK